jgi:chromate reductase
LKVLAVIGSLRSASFSRKLAQAASSLAPEGMALEIIDGRDLPLYDQDLDGEEKPRAVQLQIDQVTGADALIFVTPEFNYGIPGSLKNWIDWASRPAFRSPLKGKPALIFAHSPAPTGGARAYAQLSTVLSGTLTPVFLAPSFLVPAVHEKFDEGGALIDDTTKGRMVRTLEEFGVWGEELDAR